MFRKLMILFVVVIMLFGCTPKTEKKVEEKTTEVEFYNAPLPNFSEMFSNLDYLDTVDYDQAVPEKFENSKNDVFKASFFVGSLTADALLATKSRNKTKLSNIAKTMIDYSKFIGISKDILKMADELNVLIADDKWEELEGVLENYKTQVEISLYTSEEYDIFTLLQLGGWNEGLNRICFLLKDNYNHEKSSFIDQKGILNQLIINMGKIQNTSIKNEKYYGIAVKNLTEIKSIIYSSKDRTYTIEQIKEIFRLTELIKSAY